MSNKLPSPFTIFQPELLTRIDAQFWNFNNSKFSYPQLSHRSTHYADVNQHSQQLIAKYLHVPDNYHILYLTSTAGYGAVPFNLNRIVNNNAIYVVNDKDSQFAYGEAYKINEHTISVKTGDQETRKDIAKRFNSQAFYTFYNRVSMDNGELHAQLQPLQGQILVCNMNYCIQYTTVDVSKHGIVLFDTGHGFGLCGMTVVIVRKDLVNDQLPTCPDMMSFQFSVRAKSIVNTPYTIVPLTFIHYITQQLQLKSDQDAIKKHLQTIKQQYIKELANKTEIIATTASGFIKIKISKTVQQQVTNQLGWRVKQDELVILIQQANEGKSIDFITTIFG